MLSVVRFIFAMGLAYVCGNIAKRLNFPAIIGWLIAGMFLGSHGLNLLGAEVTGSSVYRFLIIFVQVAVGSSVGSKLIYRRIKSMISKVFGMEIMDAIVTFTVVTGVFAFILKVNHQPVIISLLFGAIAVATAPIPPVTVIDQYHCSGPLSDTVAPMTSFNNILGNLVFYPILAFVEFRLSRTSHSLGTSLSCMLLLPLVLGGIIGWLASKLVKKGQSPETTRLIYVLMLLFIACIDFYLNNHVLSGNKMIVILSGTAASCLFMNNISEDQSTGLLGGLGTVHSLSLMLFIVNVSLPLNVRNILSSGIYSIIYIIVRAIGKYAGIFIGGKLTRADDVVTKYMGIIMLPHSGVSITYSGIAAEMLAPIYPEMASFVQITISAAAIINELIAIPLARWVYQHVGEMPAASTSPSD